MISDHDSDDVFVWCTSIDDITSARTGDRTPWEFHLAETVSAPDKERIMTYMFDEDRKRSFLSILLQRASIRDHLKIDDDVQYSIERTQENKPFARKMCGRLLDPWNYNVSHHGKFVCVASHSQQLVGVDIVDILSRSGGAKSFADFFSFFEKCFAEKEIAAIFREVSEQDKYCLFYLHWALKESYVKAIGMGLKYDLKNVSFAINCHKITDKAARAHSGSRIVRGSAVVSLEEEVTHKWRFEFFSLDGRHVIAFALGTEKGKEKKNNNSTFSSSTPLFSSSSSSPSSAAAAVPLKPVKVRCVFKPVRSLLTPALATRFDTAFPSSASTSTLTSTSIVTEEKEYDVNWMCPDLNNPRGAFNSKIVSDQCGNCFSACTLL